MLYGLHNEKSSDANVQTFIVLAKDEDGSVHSFKDVYYSYADAAEDNPVVVTPSCIERDYDNGDYGLNMFRSAKLILLFRLSHIFVESDKSEPTDKGQAVFAICYPAEKFHRNKAAASGNVLTGFINVERVRLLLLIKEQLLEYLQKQFESDAFISLLEERKANEFKKSMEHGMQRYFNAMQFILSKKNLDNNDKFLLDFLRRTLNAHLFAFSKSSFNLPKEEYIDVTRKHIVQIFDSVMAAPYIANGYIPGSQRKTTIQVDNFSCHPVILNQVIPEIILNMRRNALFCFNTTKIFRVFLNKNSLVFENSYNAAVENFGHKKSIGGIAMCNNILSDLNLPKIAAKPKPGEKGIFLTTVDLIEKNETTAQIANH